jgi:two-component system, response regulator RpfG
VFDALTSVRPYKDAWSIDKALEYVSNESGRHFDPDLVAAMLSIRTLLEEIHAKHSTDRQ